MFGASWCPACAQQKAMFERGVKNIPYFECSPDGQGEPQATECTERLITSYPVWQFDEAHLLKLPDELWSDFATVYDDYVNSADYPEDADKLPDTATNFEKFGAITADSGIPYYNQ